jgi:hypothetical protein
MPEVSGRTQVHSAYHLNEQDSPRTCHYRPRLCFLHARRRHGMTKSAAQRQSAAARWRRDPSRSLSSMHALADSPPPAYVGPPR